MPHTAPDTADDAPLIEREAELARLLDAHAQVGRTGTGLTVLVSGDAGLGKTALIRAFLRRLDRPLDCAVAACEPLRHPAPLGPWLELADRLPLQVAGALRQAGADARAAAALLAWARERRSPQVLVIEDLHWADAATLDVIRYLGRRPDGQRLMLLLSLRDDETPGTHPLRAMLGDLPAAQVLRLPLRPLSPEGVDRLAARAGQAGAAVWRRTGGNPFFVTQCLANPDVALPASVADAVLARLARLPAPALRAARWAAVSPARLPLALLQAVDAAAAAAVDDALAGGLLALDGRALHYRHELARRAVYESLGPAQRHDMHAALFGILDGVALADEALSQAVHHAAAAGRSDDLLRLAPRAAQRAAERGAHHDACALYALALGEGRPTDPVLCATLWEARAEAAFLSNAHDEAGASHHQALALRRAAGHAPGVAANLRGLARLQWFQHGDAAGALAGIAQALAALDGVDAPLERARCTSVRAHLHLVAEDPAQALDWGERALAMAEALGDAEVLCHALNNVGTARARLGDTAGATAGLQHSLEVALARGHDQDAARAWLNLFIVTAARRELPEALRVAARGLAHSEARGLDLFTVRLRVRRALALMAAGRLDDAAADLDEVAQRHRPSPMEATAAGLARALLDARRGAPGGADALRAAADAMDASGQTLWFTTAAAARAEAAWLQGMPAAIAPAVTPAMQALQQAGDRWRAGELALWLHRAGAPVPEGDWPAPVALALAGDWRGAAAAWQAQGAVLEALLAAAGGGRADRADAAQQLQALGAGGLAAALRRGGGVSAAPAGADTAPARGPNLRTRTDPLGLTAREREVLQGLRQALSNRQIADRLHRSERTVEHHVAALLAKLGAASRADAVRRADAAEAGRPGTDTGTPPTQN